MELPETIPVDEAVGYYLYLGVLVSLLSEASVLHPDDSIVLYNGRLYYKDFAVGTQGVPFNEIDLKRLLGEL